MKTNTYAFLFIFVNSISFLASAQLVPGPSARGATASTVQNQASVRDPSSEPATVTDSSAQAGATAGAPGAAAGLQTVAEAEDGVETTDRSGPDVCGNVRIKFSELRLVGLPIPGRPTKCIRVPSGNITARARNMCNGLYVVNPGNPIYSSKGNGTEYTNPDHYFYCVTGIGRGWKEHVCRISAPAHYAGQYTFRWDPSRGGDGSCGYAPLGSQSFTFSWEAPEPEIVVTARGCRSYGLTSYNPTPYPPELEDDVYCSCTAPHSERYFKIGEAESQCNQLAAGDQAERSTASVATVSPPAEAQFRSCLQSWATLSRTCKQNAEDASANCQRKQERNGTVDGASNAIGALGRGVTNSRAGQGTQGTCFNTGVAALGAREALNSRRESCNTDFEVCSRDCAPDSVERFLADCPAKIGKTADQLESETGPLAEAFNTNSSEIRTNFETGTRVCQTDVQKSRSGLDRIVGEVGQVVQASTVCACQTSSTTGQNCTEIPTIDVCEQTGSAACAAYNSVSNCAVGSANYDAKACACAQNPGTPGCRPSVAANVAVSNFGGAAVPTASTGGTVSGFAGGSGGGSSGGGSFGDLSGAGGDAAASGILASNLKSSSAPIATGGGASGASVSGGGGGGGTGTAAEPAAGPQADKGGIKGLFNDLKNTVSRALFGGGPSIKKTPTAAAKATDVSKFKPDAKLRGGPVQRDIASANEKTLFELVNDCANGLRCKSVTTVELLKGP